MIAQVSGLGPSISGAWLAAGPFVVPVLLIVLAALAWLASWLIESGIRRKSRLRMALGAPLVLYLIVIAANFFINV